MENVTRAAQDWMIFLLMWAGTDPHLFTKWEFCIEIMLKPWWANKPLCNAAAAAAVFNIRAHRKSWNQWAGWSILISTSVLRCGTCVDTRTTCDGWSQIWSLKAFKCSTTFNCQVYCFFWEMFSHSWWSFWWFSRNPLFDRMEGSLGEFAAGMALSSPAKNHQVMLAN